MRKSIWWPLARGRAFNRRNLIVRALLLLAMGTSGTTSFAQDVTPGSEAMARLKLSSTVQPLGASPFGESLNLYTGDVSFTQTDVEFQGTGPTIYVSRSRREKHWIGPKIDTINGWDLDIPRIETLVARPSRAQTGTPGGNWLIENFNPPYTPTNARCSQVGPVYDPLMAPDLWWHGYDFVSDRGAKEPLLRLAQGVSQPSMTVNGSPITFTGATKSQWRIGCLSATSNGEAGEAFLAVSPDGTKYFLDHLVGITTTSVVENDVSGERIFYPRMYVAMYVSRIEDRFGNYLTYQYSGDKLTSITASDGRQVVVNWRTDAHKIDSVVVQPTGPKPQTTRYVYGADGLLSAVVLPDQTQWTYSTSGNGIAKLLPPEQTCPSRTFDPATPATTTESVYTITHPSGLVGSFAFRATRHARSYVPSSCYAPGPGVLEQESNYPIFNTGSLIEKRLSGPGVPMQTWSYLYSPVVASTTHDACAQAGTCLATKWVDETGPDGTRIRYTYSNRWDATEGKLLTRETYPAGASTPARTEAHSYAAATGGPYPPVIGGPIMVGDVNTSAMSSVVPERSRIITELGTQFQWNVESGCGGYPYCFDTFGRPTRVKRSSPWHSRTDQYAYHDNTGRWVLGKLLNETNLDTGRVTSETTYDANSMPLEVKSFGATLRSYTYNTDGTLHTSKDGNYNTTTLSNWKRGVPQTVSYPPTPESPNGASSSAVVDDNGWVRSTTDENGFTTSYDYWDMGRIRSTTYPGGDSVNWNTSTQVFEQVASSEYGLAGSHWRHTVSVGNARKITYYDAFWRPVVTREYDAANEAGTQRFQRLAYDHAGRTTFASYPGTTDQLTSGTWSEYDTFGRITSVSQDSEQGLLTTFTEYLPAAQTRVTNPRQFVTTTGYQVFDQPRFDAPVWIQHPEGAYTEIERDVFGKTKTLTRRNASGSERVDRRYVYQADQLLCKAIEPETGVSVFGYDGAGNVTRSATGLGGLTDLQTCNQAEAWASGRAVDRTYDARGRLKTLAFPDSNGNQWWTYTPDSQVDTITTQNGGSQATNTYTYNRRRLLIGEGIQQPGLYAWSLGYGYDANGALSQITYPQNLSVDYAPNALGQATKAGPYASNVSYYPNGGIKQFTYGNGIVHSMQQNARQLPAQVADGAVLNHTYSYDKNGNVAQILDGVVANANRTMAYDGLDRLTAATSASFGGNGQATFTYDVLDNLKTSKLAGVREFNYWYDTYNRLTNIRTDAGATTIGLAYDAQGNLRDKNGQLFQFDYGNRLREATGKESYRYDGHGRRIQSTDPNLGATGNLFSMYGQDGALRYQEDQRRSTRYHYIMLAGSLVAKQKTVLAPAAPVLSVPTYSATGTYTVSWSSVSGVTQYELQEAVNGGTWQNVYAGASTTFNVSGKASGNYSYQVRACNGAACSGWSGQAIVGVELPPSATPSLTAPSQAPNGNYSVNWTSVSGVTRYVLEENANAAGWVAVQDGPGIARTYSAKAAGSYAYRAKACNPAGCGPASNTATVNVYYAPGGVPTVSAPGSNANGSYTVSWTTVAGATSYRIEESANGGAWTQLQELSTTTLAVGGRGSGSYGYRVRACNGAGCGGYSATATTSVLLPPTGVPSISVPGSSGNGSYTVSWSGVAEATSYQLEEQVNGGGWTLIQNDGNTSRAIGGKGNGSYGYHVRGCNASGCAGWSATGTVVVSLPPPIPPPPASLDGSVEYDNSVRPPAKETNLWWPASAGATYYEVSVGTTTILYSGPYNSYTDWLRTTRSFYVRACNSAGCSAWTGPKTL